MRQASNSKRSGHPAENYASFEIIELSTEDSYIRGIFVDFVRVASHPSVASPYDDVRLTLDVSSQEVHDLWSNLLYISRKYDGFVGDRYLEWNHGALIASLRCAGNTTLDMNAENA